MSNRPTPVAKGPIAQAPTAASFPSASAAVAPVSANVTIEAKEEPATHLVLMLHGVGDSAGAFQGLARLLVDALPRATFVVPDGFHPFDGGGKGRQWFSLRDVTDENRAERVKASGEEVSRWIDGELARRKLNSDKLVIIGFSQGAIVASWLAVQRTPRPAAVVVLSGRSGLEATALPSAKAKASGPRVFVAHGERDEVIPVSNVEPTVRVLEAWGARVTKRVYPHLAHQVDDTELRDVQDFLKTAIDKP